MRKGNDRYVMKLSEVRDTVWNEMVVLLGKYAIVTYRQRKEGWKALFCVL